MMTFKLREMAEIRSALQVLWHNATPEVKAAFQADGDNPEELIELIDQRTREYLEEIHRTALKDSRKAVRRLEQ